MSKKTHVSIKDITKNTDSSKSLDKNTEKYFGFNDDTDTESDDDRVSSNQKGHGKKQLQTTLKSLKKSLPPPKPTRNAGPTRLLATTKSRNLFKPSSMNQQSIEDAVKNTTSTKDVDIVPPLRRTSNDDSFNHLFTNDAESNEEPVLFEPLWFHPEKVYKTKLI